MPIDPKAVIWESEPKRTTSPAQFKETYGPAAERVSRALGVPSSVILGQWGLETGWGKSIIPGTNNLGNIKDFSGSGTAATDNMTGSRDKYRTYESPDAFADDYVSLVQRKYPGAVGAKNANAFAAALKSGGYAEDPAYVTKVAQASGIVDRQPGPVMAGLSKIVNAVVPSARAAQPSAGIDPAQVQWEDSPEPATKPKPQSAAINRNAVIWEPEQPSGGAAFGVYPKARRDAKNNSGDATASVLKGVASGFADVGNTIINSGTKASADTLAGINDPHGLIDPRFKRAAPGALSPSEQENAQRAQGLQAFNEENKDAFFSGGRILGNVAATYPVGGVLGAPLKAAAPAGSVLNRLGTALTTGGATTGAPVAQGLASGAANMGLRMAGGAITGGASAGLIDPTATALGSGVGGFLPPAARLVGASANSLGSFFRPFTASGQNHIAGNALREFATDPVAARHALASAAEVVPGSAPITATAAGDSGLAALSRSMQNASPEYAANLAARQTAQNQARTAALEGIAGNTGKIEIAERSRDAVTGTMREEALNAAGKVPAQGILQQIDDLIADPNNAGQLSQQALNQFRSRIASFTKDGAIDARALYAIRKDINDVLGGKLQGEAGNLKYAASQLSGVRGFIDDAIDQSARSMPANAIGPTTKGTPDWKGYLRKYAEESIPINQMERLEKILIDIKTGAVDSQGGAIISAAKLNNVLKNQGSDLVKELSPQQLQVLRNIQADLNASQIANNVGRAVGSNTVQNLGQNQLLESVMGKRLGGSAGATSTIGRALQLPYGTANRQIQERLGNALLDPREAARLMDEPGGNSLLRAFQNSAIPYKAAPAITAQ